MSPPDGRRGRPLTRNAAPTDPTKASLPPATDIGAACGSELVGRTGNRRARRRGGAS
jgi:hypothetical protein